MASPARKKRAAGLSQDADDLASRPDKKIESVLGGCRTGIAVPGMPIGSPGMEQGERRDAYTVVSFDTQGRIAPFQKYPAK